MSFFDVPWLLDEEAQQQSGETNVTGSGGVVVGSTATTQATYNPSPTGGVVIGSTASTQATYSPSTSGGVVIGGSGQPAIEPGHSGGIVIGSEAAAQAIYNPTAAGGVVIGSTADCQAVYSPAAAGGVVIGSAAATSQTAQPGGGVVIGGAADVSLDDGDVITEEGSGGVVIGDSAASQAVYSPAAAGGVLIGSEAATSQTAQPGGGVVIGSTAANSATYAPSTSGGTVIGGAADVSLDGGDVITEEGTGGIVLDGSAALSVESPADESCCQITNNVSTSGGLRIGGAASVSTNFERGSGGLSVGGAAVVSIPTQTYEDFEAVYHLLESGDGTPDEFLDSTAHAYHGQGGQGFAIRTPTRTQGVFYFANEFDGNDFVNCPEFSLADSSPVTVTLWAKRTNRFLPRVFYSTGATSTGEGWQIQIGHDSRNRLTARVQVEEGDDWARYEAVGSTTLDADCWYHCAAVWSPGNGLSLYLNGQLEDFVAVDATTLAPSSAGSYIGRLDNAAYAQAKLQEVRICPLPRSDDWLAAEFDSICDDAFYSVSAEENPVYA